MPSELVEEPERTRKGDGPGWGTWSEFTYWDREKEELVNQFNSVGQCALSTLKGRFQPQIMAENDYIEAGRA